MLHNVLPIPVQFCQKPERKNINGILLCKEAKEGNARFQYPGEIISNIWVGFPWVLENLESLGISILSFPGLDSHGIHPLYTPGKSVNPGYMFNDIEKQNDKKCLAHSII